MPTYLVETYLARVAAGTRAACERRARSAADELSSGRTRIRFDGSLHVLDDETCFFIFAAPTARAAALAAERAGLDALRVVEAVASRKERQ